MNSQKDKEARELVDIKTKRNKWLIKQKARLRKLEIKSCGHQISIRSRDSRNQRQEENGTKEEIKAAMDKLQNMLGSMAQAAGAGAQPNPDAGCGAGCNPEPETNKKNDGPIDAEYEVVDDDKK